MLQSVLSKRDVNTQVLPHGVDRSWFDKAISSINQLEYAVKVLDQPDVMGAVNHPQHLRFIFSPKGYTASHIITDANTSAAWNTAFAFAGIGRNGQLHEKALRHSALTGEHSARYEYGDYAITYDNGQLGMEQRILIGTRPQGKGDLQIAMDLSGDLQARTDEKGALLMYAARDPKNTKLVYDQLKVWDRNGKILPSRMVMNGTSRLVLKVDDKGAAYPITVDPLNHIPNFTTSENQGGLLSIANTAYGISVCGNVDIDKDGISDIVIGAPVFLNITNFTTPAFGTTSVGAVFIFLGGNPTPSTTPARVLQPSGVAGALFGFSVASAGDLDKDGYKDLVVGAPGDQVTLNVGLIPVPTSVAVGKVYTYHSSTSFAVAAPQATPALTYTLGTADFGPFLFSVPANPCYGWSVSGAGDFNNDGADDLLIGAPFFSTPGAGLGRVDLYQSTASGTPISNATVPNEITSAGGEPDLFGFSLAKGNFNSDGFWDFVVGAPATIGVTASKVYIFHGTSTLPATLSVTSATMAITSPSTGSALLPLSLGNLYTLFGYSVATTGDINGDGKDDLIVGAPLARDNSLASTVAAGHAYVFYSNPLPLMGIQAVSYTTLSSPRSPAVSGLVQGHTLFGFSVGAADANLDGKPDVIVGEPGSSALGAAGANLSSLLGTTGISTLADLLSGQAYIFYGNGTTVATTPAFKLFDPGVLTVANLLGAAVGNLGDVNGDGKPDIFMAAPGAVLDISANVVSGSGNRLSIRVIPSGIGLVNVYFASSVTLPVNLLNFSGQKDNGTALLNWSTAQEQNSDHFEIERSADNNSFSSIGQVAAAHNSSLIRNYTFTDAAPLTGNNYYRLKMVDMDGKFTYSKVVVLDFTTTGIRAISVYPNPAHGSFQLKFSNMPAGRYDLNVVNAIGQQMFSKQIQVGSQAVYTQTVDLTPGLASGSYLIRIVDQQQHTYISRIVVN